MEQTARKKIESLRTRSKQLERDSGIGEHGTNRSKESRELENKAQTARKRLQKQNKGELLERD